MKIDDMPNIMILDDVNEKPHEIVEDYLEMIWNYRNDKKVIEGLLFDMFDDVNYWTVRQMFIDQAKINLQHLKELTECEHAFIDEDEED